MTHALEEHWACIAKSRPGKEKTTCGASLLGYKLEDLGVMKRTEFYAACVRRELDKILGCNVYNPVDHTRMNSLYDTLIAYSVFVEHRLANGMVRVPYRDYRFSKGAEWKQRYQLLKTGWMMGMGSTGVAEMVAAWRAEDKPPAPPTPPPPEPPPPPPEPPAPPPPPEPPAPPPEPPPPPTKKPKKQAKKPKKQAPHPAVAAYDKFKATAEPGKAAGPGGFSFVCVRRKVGDRLDFYARARCGKVLRSRVTLDAFLKV